MSVASTVVTVFRQRCVSLFTPASLSNLVQRFLDGNPTYSASTLQSYPILAPEETGTVAVPRGQRCALFDGSNDYGALGARLTSGASANLYAAAWIKTSGNTIAIMSEYDSNSSIRSWYMRVSATGKLQVFLSADGGTTNFKDYSSATSINTGSWVHVAFTFIAGVLTLYVNGVAETATKTTDGTVASLFSTTAPFAIGAVNIASGITSFFSGSMYGARVGIVAKSPTEIAAIYNQASTPSTIDTTGLLGMWPMQEESGTTAYDVSGNGKHLTLTNITQATFHAVDSGVSWNYGNWKGHTSALTLSGTFTGWTNADTWVGSNALTGDFSVSWMVTAASNAAIVGVQTESTPTASANYENIDYGFRYKSGSLFTVWINGVQYDYSGTVAVGDLLTCSRSGSVISFYRNGALLRSDTISSSTMYPVQTLNVGGGLQYALLGSTTMQTAGWKGSAITTGSLVIPASLSTPSQDAAGNALGVTGPVAHPATMEVPCVTGDGTAVYCDLGSALIPATADFSLSFWYYSTVSSNNARLMSQESTGTGQFSAAILTDAAGGIKPYINGSVGTAISLTPGNWYLVQFSRSGSTWSLTANSTTVTMTSSFSVQVQNTWLLGRLLSAAGRICDLQITTGGVTTYFPLQEGSTTSRDLYYAKSDGTGGKVANAIVNGTIATIRANRCPYAKDWAVQYGGGTDANSAFVPGLIGGANDANGAAKTLSAGKHGNVYSVRVPNLWSAPELCNLGVTSSTKLSPSQSLSSVATTDCGWSRVKSDGTDRNILLSSPATGSDKTNLQTYTG